MFFHMVANGVVVDKMSAVNQGILADAVDVMKQEIIEALKKNWENIYLDF